MRALQRLAAIALVALVALAALGLSFFLTHRQSVPASEERAEAEFTALRARFAGEQPLIDMNRRRPVEFVEISRVTSPLRSFRTVIFDTRDGQRIVRIDVPYWVARRFAGRDRMFTWLGQLTFLDDTEFDPEAIRLSLDEIERRGPGLVADYRHQTGGQFLSWVE